MKIEKVYGNEIPPKFEYLRGVVFINALPEKVESEDSELYSYHQTFTMETNEELLEKKYIRLMCEVYKEYLSNTDHKFFNGYKPKEDEDLVEIGRLRDEARDFIRANEVSKLDIRTGVV